MANRATLEATANEAIDAARASGGACALAFADLNDLKRVNDGPEITAMLAETIAPDRRR